MAKLLCSDKHPVYFQYTKRDGILKFLLIHEAETRYKGDAYAGVRKASRDRFGSAGTCHRCSYCGLRFRWLPVISVMAPDNDFDEITDAKNY